MTSTQKNIIAQYASSGWNEGLSSSPNPIKSVYQDAVEAGVATQALCAYVAAYEGGRKQAKIVGSTK